MGLLIDGAMQQAAQPDRQPAAAGGAPTVKISASGAMSGGMIGARPFSPGAGAAQPAFYNRLLPTLKPTPYSAAPCRAASSNI